MDKIRIVVLQRGWVVVGKYAEIGDDVVLTQASVIRRWGTSQGLGEIALNGPTAVTRLDYAGTVTANKYTTVLMLDCEAEKWFDVLR